MLTSEHLAKIFPHTPKAKRDRFLPALNKLMPLYGINSFKRVCAFLATGGVETDYLKVTTEYASGAAYEGRKDLGNTQRGDGELYRGRGFFQTTGRYNYWRVVLRFLKKLTKIDYKQNVATLIEANRLGVNFIKNPHKLAEIEIAVESACIFWQENDLAKYADAGEFKKLSAVVNCGNPHAKPNHWAKRNELYSKCKRVLPADFSLSNEAEKDATTAIEPIVLTPTEPAVSTTTTPSAEPPPSEDSFLTNAFDKNVSADDARTMAKNALPSLGVRIWRFIARPVLWIYAALEAGNIAAWLGVAVIIIVLVYLAYQNRAKLLKFWEKVKAKFIS